MASIYMLGDSHTQALGPRLAGSFADHDFNYEAFPGHNTSRAWAAASPGFNNDVVIVALGGNDFGDQSEARAGLLSYLRARNPDAPIFWFGPAHAVRPDVGQRHDLQAIDQNIQLPYLGVEWYDSRPWTLSGHRSDGVHFTRSAYSDWASKIAVPVRSAAEMVEKDPVITLIGVIATAAAAFVVWNWINERTA